MPDTPSLPPSLSGQPPMGASPVGVPTGSPGANAAALSKVREAIKILQDTLPGLPIGSDVHKAIMNSISSMAKYAPASAEVPGVQKTTASNLMQDAQKSAMMDMVNKGLSGGQTTGAGPGGSGMSSPPGAGAAMPPSLMAA